MKTTEANNKTTGATQVQVTPKMTIEDLVSKAKFQNPDGGSMTLKEIGKALKIDNFDVIQLARKINNATLVFGRKGADSRICWGSEVPKHMLNPKSPAKRHYNKSPQTRENSFHSPVLRITVGNFTQTIPIGLSLVEA